MRKRNLLLTGGAGFIGSNLLRTFLEDDRIGFVRVLDNLSTGNLNNIHQFSGRSNYEFVNGDIRDYEVCLAATEGIDMICHQAALGSVPRSVENPLLTNEVNITGTLNVFNAAVARKIDRIVYAASSSTYGDNDVLPKREESIGAPLSPYAVTKYVNELYAKVFNRTYGIHSIGLRYFNVFGPHQSPEGAYAAVIPLFIQAALRQQSPRINGDGCNSRDFTYVDNAVQANVLALFTENPLALDQVYNIACGEQTSLNELWGHIKSMTDCSVDPFYGPPRQGDIPHSLADIQKANTLLGYQPKVSVMEGLSRTVNWFKEK
jgi:UDP-N-acetylglucosamine 4-epimerase